MKNTNVRTWGQLRDWLDISWSDMVAGEDYFEEEENEDEELFMCEGLGMWIEEYPQLRKLINL